MQFAAQPAGACHTIHLQRHMGRCNTPGHHNMQHLAMPPKLLAAAPNSAGSWHVTAAPQKEAVYTEDAYYLSVCCKLQILDHSVSLPASNCCLTWHSSATQTLNKQSNLPAGSDSSVSQMRTESGKGNSCVSRRVIHRKAKNWGSTCKQSRHNEHLLTRYRFASLQAAPQ
eukprot:GHRR01026652.1.p1 GENE.GHRR01026652.1~~GHRR01026652.1.p1  ORF type:complete len:170 (+),score=33.72 GHRR01026652.1:318-827(+)